MSCNHASSSYLSVEDCSDDGGHRLLTSWTKHRFFFLFRFCGAAAIGRLMSVLCSSFNNNFWLASIVADNAEIL